MTRKERSIEPVFTSKELNLIKCKGLRKEDEKKLILQAQRLDELCVSQQKGSTYLASKVPIGKTAIQNYRKGINFISNSVIGSLSKELGVSEDYLRGKTDVKKIENEKINELTGLNDNSIRVLGSLINKEYLNLLFDNDEIYLQFLLNETKKFIELSKKLNDFIASHESDDKLEYNEEYIKLYGDVQLASFNMSQEYIRLISNNIKKEV